QALALRRGEPRRGPRRLQLADAAGAATGGERHLAVHRGPRPEQLEEGGELIRLRPASDAAGAQEEPPRRRQLAVGEERPAEQRVAPPAPALPIEERRAVAGE